MIVHIRAIHMIVHIRAIHMIVHIRAIHMIVHIRVIHMIGHIRHSYMTVHIWVHIHDCSYMYTHIICVLRSCAICRFRKGWSSLRKGTPHGKAQIQRLWRLCIDTERPNRRAERFRTHKRSREQLVRHGFHAKRRCTLLDHAKKILVRDPTLHRESLFASVIFNDLLHWEKNCCDYAIDALLGVMTDEMKLECDRNARRLTMFRNPDGSSIRQFRQVSAVSYLTTARRLTLMFVWVHALGSGACMLPENCRRPALTMLSAMQTMILAAQGRRAYSVAEWSRLHVDTAREFFASMELLMNCNAANSGFRPMLRYHTHI